MGIRERLSHRIFESRLLVSKVILTKCVLRTLKMHQIQFQRSETSYIYNCLYRGATWPQGKECKERSDIRKDR